MQCSAVQCAVYQTLQDTPLSPFSFRSIQLENGLQVTAGLSRFNHKWIKFVEAGGAPGHTCVLMPLGDTLPCEPSTPMCLRGGRDGGGSSGGES